MEPSEVAENVRRATAGDEAAWEALIGAFGGMVWSVALAHRLSRADAAEVVQITWLRLLEHLSRIEYPERVGGWLSTTARNEALRMLRLRGREVLGDDRSGGEWAVSSTPTPEVVVLDQERDERLWAAFGRLDVRCRTLLWLTVLEGPSYAQVAISMDVPIGSIGPFRARCLGRLRKLLDEEGGDRDDLLRR